MSPTFSRAYLLPAEAATEKARATFKEGILEIRVPKTEGAKKKGKTVPIE